MGGKRKTIQDAHNLAESMGIKFLSPVFEGTKTKYFWGCAQGHEWSANFNHIQMSRGCSHCSGKAKKTIQDAHNLAKSRGFKFLSSEFKNTQIKHKWGCSEGHDWFSAYNTIQQGSGCPHCAGLTPKTIKDAHKLAESRGFKFLSTEFVTGKRKHLWQCGEGHEWSAMYNWIKQGNGCPECAGKSSKTLKHALALAELRGYKFLSTEMKNNSTKYLWRCDKGHEWMATFSTIQGGHGCYYCKGSIPKTIQDAHDLAQIKGFQFLSSEFLNAKTKHLWRCGKGHDWMTSYNSVRKGGCPDCAGLKPKTIEDAHNLAKSKGFQFLSSEFISPKTKHLWGCKKGHNFMTSYGSIQSGTGCTVCSDRTRGERMTRYCFEKIFKYDFKKIRPQWMINPKTNARLELDGYNESLKLAFEHQGIQHETGCHETNKHFDSQIFFRDEVKRQKCKERGIILIEVPEIGRRLKVKDVVPFLLSEFDKHKIAYPESAKNFQIDMKELYA